MTRATEVNPGYTHIKEYILFVFLMLCVTVNKLHIAQYIYLLKVSPNFPRANRKVKKWKWKKSLVDFVVAATAWIPFFLDIFSTISYLPQSN